MDKFKKRIIALIVLSMILPVLLMLLSSVIGMVGVKMWYDAVSFFFNKDYRDDIRIELNENEGVLVIREWSRLHGSGVKFYYELDGKTYHLGDALNNSVGDGSTFANGDYVIEEEDNTVSIKWKRRYNYSESSELSEYVYEETFELPTN